MCGRGNWLKAAFCARLSMSRSMQTILVGGHRLGTVNSVAANLPAWERSPQLLGAKSRRA